MIREGFHSIKKVCETLKFAEGFSSFAFRSCLDRYLSLQGGRARSQMARGGKQGFQSIGD